MSAMTIAIGAGLWLAVLLMGLVLARAAAIGDGTLPTVGPPREPGDGGDLEHTPQRRAAA